MSYWDCAQSLIVRFKPEEIADYPGWQLIDCGCCNGIEWGGDFPRECRRCGGSGVIYRHKRSGVLADYPGGPFRGRDVPEETT